MSESGDNVREKLRGEVMALGWADLLPQFARGALILVTAELDLLDVAEALARDDRARVESWLAGTALWRATDADARRFQAERPRFQCVIVQPWVLAQGLHAPTTQG